LDWGVETVARIHLGNGTRIGIAASLIWFVLFGGYLIATWSGELRDSYQHQLDTCYRTLNSKAQNLANGKARANTRTALQRFASVKLAQDLLDLLLMDIGTIFFGWIAVMSATLAIRWTRKGFA
jgi:hypothetical protein